jgi:hypothetical protein
VSEVPDVPPPNEASVSLDAPSPPPVPKKPASRLRFVLLVLGGVLVAVCGGGAFYAWKFVHEIADIAAAPPGEREALLSKKLESMAADQTSAVDAFLAAVDEGRDDDAWAMASSRLRTITPRDKFGDTMTLIRSVVGRCKSKQLRNLDSRSNLDGTSTSSMLYAATFEKGDGTIKADLVTEDGNWKVFGWNVNSPLFMDAMKKGAGK